MELPKFADVQRPVDVDIRSQSQNHEWLVRSRQGSQQRWRAESVNYESMGKKKWKDTSAMVYRHE